METEPQGFGAGQLVLKRFGVMQDPVEPAFDFGDYTIYSAVELDACPAETAGIYARLPEAIVEVVVVVLLAAVLEEQAEPDAGACEVTEHGAGVDGLGRTRGDATTLGVWQSDEAGYAIPRGAPFVQALGYAA